MRYGKALYSRREFMRSTLYLTAAAATAPSFLTRTSLAVANPHGLASLPGVPDDHILIVIQLSGGNDGLNTIVPFNDPNYYNYRPTLALPRAEILPINDDLAVHRGLRNLQGVYDGGEFAWIQGVGYPNPNRSHFRSMEIWQTASDADAVIRSGWIGRYFDNTCEGEQPPPASAVTIGREQPQALRTSVGMPTGIALRDPDRFAWQSSARTSTQQRNQQDLLKQFSRASALNTPDIDYLQRTALDALDAAELVRQAERRYRATVEYPNNRFGHDLQTVAKLIHGKVGGRIFYVSIGGFDTHATQAATHARLLETLADGLSALRRDLVRAREWDRVMIVGFSEFGRRVDENASQGTDHGAAGPMFVMGKHVKPGLHGRHPSLEDLGNNDLKYAIDFRSVYGTIIEKWLGAPHDAVLGRRFPMLDVIRG